MRTLKEILNENAPGKILVVDGEDVQAVMEAEGENILPPLRLDYFPDIDNVVIAILVRLEKLTDNPEENRIVNKAIQQARDAFPTSLTIYEPRGNVSHLDMERARLHLEDTCRSLVEMITKRTGSPLILPIYGYTIPEEDSENYMSVESIAERPIRIAVQICGWKNLVAVAIAPRKFSPGAACFAPAAKRM